MNIIWLTTECPFPVNSGGRNVMWNKISRMAEKHNVYLFSIIDEACEAQYKEDMLKCCKQVNLYERSKSIKTLIKSLWYPYPAVSRWNETMKADIKECCERIAPDYIIVEFPQMVGNLGQEILSKYKIIISQHNIEFEAMKNIASGISSPIRRAIYKFVAHQLERYEEHIYKNVNVKLYTFVSISDKEFFENKYSLSNTLLLPIGANIKAEKEIPTNQTLIFVAKMSYTPNDIAGQWFLDKVWPSVIKTLPEARLFLVGKDPSEELLEKAKSLNSVIVTGVVDSVDEYYSKATAVVVPILNGGGVKVKLIEALGHNKIVITTRKGLEGTDFVPGKHVLAADDADEFANICVEVLRNSQAFNAIKDEAFEKMKQEYSWAGIVSSFEDALTGMTRGF